MSVCAGDVYNKLQQIKGNAGQGPDGVQGVVLKSCAAALAPSLSRVFNCSLQQGKLAKDWKTAEVVAVPKGGDKSDMENYRPISMTSLIGKTLEIKARPRQSADFLEENKIIPDCQVFGQEDRAPLISEGRWTGGRAFWTRRVARACTPSLSIGKRRSTASRTTDCCPNCPIMA
jgi:hypothetical protein